MKYCIERAVNKVGEVKYCIERAVNKIGECDVLYRKGSE